jgi:hypothetical protein
MLEAIVGGVTAERVLLYLQAYDEAYGREIASTFGPGTEPGAKTA